MTFIRGNYGLVLLTLQSARLWTVASAAAGQEFHQIGSTALSSEFSMRAFTLLVLATAVLTACDQKKPEENHFELVDAIYLSGICREDHVLPRPENVGRYTGTIVRYRDKRNGSLTVYGSVFRTNSVDPDVIEAEVEHPERYYPADSIDFELDAFDTSAQRWTVHGISDRASEEQEAQDPPMTRGYATTCQLQVVKRGKTIEEVDPDAPKPSVPQAQ